MQRLIRFMPIIGLLLCLATPALSQPVVTITAETINAARSVIITFQQDNIESMQGCHYNLFAAKKRRDLETLPGKGLSIATFKRDSAVVQIIAGPLRTIKRANSGGLKASTINIFLRTLISCPEAESGLGEIISFSVPTNQSGELTNTKGYLRDMKYHMKYYQP